MANKTPKPKITLIPSVAIVEEAKALTYGEMKHGKYGWKDGSVTISELLDAAMRHILQFKDGENIDAESSCNHLGNARANLAMALDLFSQGIGDDRYHAKKDSDNAAGS